MGTPNPLVQGPMDVLILNVLSSEPKHGWAIAKRIQQSSPEQLKVPQGSLYPALYRLEGQRLLKAEWKQGPSGREAKFYALTAAGQKRLEHAGWISGRRQRDGGRHINYYSLATTGRRVLLRSKNQRGRGHLSGTATALAFSMAATAAAAQDAGTLPHVRSSSPFLRELFTQGAVQSPTFRSLVDAIDDTDGIVYVENGRCGHHVHNCLLLSVIPTGGFRFLRILVDVDRVHGHDSELIASIGHELRHALEVLAEPHVRSTIDMLSLYANQAGAQEGHFETPAAVRAGDQVLKELSRATSHSRTAPVLTANATIIESQGIRHGQTE